MTVVTEAALASRAAGVPLLQAEGVTMRFGGLTAVNNVSVTVNEGEIVGSSDRTVPARRRSSTA